MMKKLFAFIGLMAFTFSLEAQIMDSTWFRPRTLIGHPMPPVNGVTINGVKVDPTFFKGRVVALAFGNLINVASLKQIEALNRLQDTLKGQPFTVLAVMPNARQDVIDFNSDSNKGMGHSLRMTFSLPVMQYPVMPTCEERKADNTLGVACDNVVKDYLIGGYPVLCVIDQSGIVRYVHVGMPARNQMDEWYNRIYGQVSNLLKDSR